MEFCRAYVFPANRGISEEPTSGLKNRFPLLELRVIHQALQGFAWGLQIPRF
jgi:hypothetical protein